MEHAEHEVIGSKATEPNSNIATSQYTFPLPQDLQRSIIQLIEDSEEEVFQQIVQLQTLAEVSKEFYMLIAQRLAEESRKQGLKVIPKLLEIEKNKIGLVGILHRYPKYYFELIVNFSVINYLFQG